MGVGGQRSRDLCVREEEEVCAGEESLVGVREEAVGEETLSFTPSHSRSPAEPLEPTSSSPQQGQSNPGKRVELYHYLFI